MHPFSFAMPMCVINIYGSVILKPRCSSAGATLDHSDVQKPGPLNTGGVSLPAADAQVLNKSLPSTQKTAGTQLPGCRGGPILASQSVQQLKLSRSWQTICSTKTFLRNMGSPLLRLNPTDHSNLDPASLCFQYCPNVFEGLKVRCPRIFMHR